MVLLSLYRDKIGTEEPVEPKYRNLRERIMSSVYQSSSSSWSSPSSLSSFPTFPEFVQYVFGAQITLFPQVKCLMPYWAECGVCANDFNIIIKAETMTEDEQFFLTVADLGHSNMEVVKQQEEVKVQQQEEVVEGQQQEVVKGQQQEVVEGQQQKESSAAAAAVKRKESPWEEVTRYYSQLTRHQMTELHQRYKLDFDLFGYEIDAYLAWPEMD
ncbi:putative Sulfotransferase domain-containing protein 8 [Homarus americanus]|uniref:Carbohydrate sulfotransferase n=1 Tax=Homarus americanus TaxID=6706 RepID=A0A8J5MM60_HOMAM|nr:putative Sulfotransferase domain-containing protein 8 [Homarus americanus]